MAVYEHRFTWMRPEAPYAPVSCIGLLHAIAPLDRDATAHWEPASDGLSTPALTIRSTLDLAAMAEGLMAAPWPDLDRLEWPTPPGQAIKPTLAKIAGDGPGDQAAVQAWRELAGLGDGDGKGGDGTAATRRLIAALVTDGALDGSGLPSRSRLLRGVKADLSGPAKPPRTTAAHLAAELETGPQWMSGSSGLGLGFVPEVQTFGGTTGPNPQSVGAFSRLLYRLCWFGISAMPPFGVARGPQRVVGGPLFATPDTLSWPIWTFPLGRTSLSALFGLATIHAEQPDPALLRARGIDAVFRSKAREINRMISVFGWGARVA